MSVLSAEAPLTWLEATWSAGPAPLSLPLESLFLLLQGGSGNNQRMPQFWARSSLPASQPHSDHALRCRLGVGDGVWGTELAVWLVGRPSTIHQGLYLLFSTCGLRTASSAVGVVSLFQVSL